MTGIPFLNPVLRPMTTNGFDYIVGGSLFPPPPASPLPAELLGFVNASKDLVYYDWEITGSRIQTGFYLGQLIRMACNKPQLPGQSAASSWLRVASTKLGNSVTVITQNEASRFSYVRQSTVGFTAFDLHILADWLASPQFPKGFYTLLAPPVENPLAPGDPSQQ